MYDWSAYSQKLRSDVLTDRGKWEREGANNMDYLQIEKVIGREILDSRGNPTVEAEVYLIDGTVGRGTAAAHLPESLKRWSFVTEIRIDILEKVCRKLWRILTL